MLIVNFKGKVVDYSECVTSKQTTNFLKAVKSASKPLQDTNTLKYQV